MMSMIFHDHDYSSAIHDFSDALSRHCAAGACQGREAATHGTAKLAASSSAAPEGTEGTIREE